MKTIISLITIFCIPIIAYAQDSDIENFKAVEKSISPSTKSEVIEFPKVTPHSILAVLKSELEPELKKLNPKATFEFPEGNEGRSLTVRFDTKDYVVHVKTMCGPTNKTITSEGPSDQGFRLGIHVQPLGTVNQAVVPQVIKDEYWKTYLNVYPVKDTQYQLYFGLSYNTKTDKVLLDKIKETAKQLEVKTPSKIPVSTSDSSWSKAINGLRARLEVLPPNRKVSLSKDEKELLSLEGANIYSPEEKEFLLSGKPEPFCGVYIKFQNVSDVAGNMKIRFAPHKLKLVVVDQNGKKLAAANGPYDGMSPTWEEPLLLPYDGTLKFRVSFHGLGYQPGKDKIIVDMGPSRSWIIPQDGSTYYLSGSLTIEKEEGDHHPHQDWSGTLELPKVAIPCEKK